MAKQVLTISSILGGITPSFYGMQDGQYLSGLAIDPNANVRYKVGGAIYPVKYTTASSTNCNSAPMWEITNPKDSLFCAYLANGRFLSYTSNLGSETLIGTPTSGAGNGAAYYNNYIYLMTPNDVSRYGPINNSPSLVNGVWTGATLGSQTALTNTTYPGFGSGLTYPNHAPHEHFGSLYFCDFKNGQGIINRITTKKITNEGDTDDGSAYNVLDLPFGYMPMDIESFGEDLIVLATQTTTGTIKQGQSVLFLWNTIDPAPYRKIPMPDPLGTALLNNNGIIHIFTGSTNNDSKHYTYSGGYSVKLVDALPTGYPAPAGAVDSNGSRVIWPGYWNNLANSTLPAVYAKGYTEPSLPDALNCIAQSASGTIDTISALKYYLQDFDLNSHIAIGWRGSGTAGIDTLSSGGGGGAVFYSPLFDVGKPFSIKKIRIPMASGSVVSSGVSVAVTAVMDSNTSYNFTTVNQTNFPDAQSVSLSAETARGDSFFYLTFTFTGTADIVFGLPIIIDIDTFDEYGAK